MYYQIYNKSYSYLEKGILSSLWYLVNHQAIYLVNKQIAIFSTKPVKFCKKQVYIKRMAYDIYKYRLHILFTIDNTEIMS